MSSSIPRNFRYWPPSHRGSYCQLPSGRKSFFVHLKRNDIDGTQWEPVLSFATRAGDRLFSLDKEEFQELRKVLPRLLSLGNLWKEKSGSSDSRVLSLPDIDLHRQ